MKNNQQAVQTGNLRQELIAAALRITNEKGAEAITMRGLGQEIGVSRTAPYGYFKNKRDLLHAVAEEGFRTIERFNAELLSRAEPNALYTLEAFGRAYVGFALDNPGLYRLMFGDEVIGEDRPPAMVEATDRAFGYLLAAFERGQKQGRIKPGNAFAMASVMWSIMHGLSSLLIDGQLPAYARHHGGEKLPPGVADDPRRVSGLVLDQAVEVLMRGIAAVHRTPDDEATSDDSNRDDASICALNI